MSPAIHNRAFAELGLDFVYLAFRVEEVKAAMEGMRALENFTGLSVTIPHKTAVIPHLDDIATVDATIGSVNTVVKTGGRVKGLGTDGPGARRALTECGVALEDRDILLLGSGGAARAIAFDLAFHARPSALTILGVIPDELDALERDLKQKTEVSVTSALVTDASLEQNVENAQVLIHATPVGMHPNTEESVVPDNLLRSDLAVMDIVYNPLETRLLKDAAKRGAKTISGLEMFVNQAVLQFEAWTGQEAPVEVMREVVLANLG
jgi:shikimate dehydrogenase